MAQLYMSQYLNHLMCSQHLFRVRFISDDSISDCSFCPSLEPLSAADMPFQA